MLGNKRGILLQDNVADYVVFDLETTGISPMKDFIIEISAVKVENRKVTDTFSSLVNPKRPIPYAASAVNGITDEMVKDEPTIDEVLPKFIDFIGDSILIGHNIHSFDMIFIWNVTEALYGKTITNHYIDTLPMARSCLSQLRHHRLVDIAAYYKISTAGAHRALADCMMNQKCYEKLAKEYMERPIRKCPKCGSEMKRRNGKFGEFWGCGSFPGCRYTENI